MANFTPKISDAGLRFLLEETPACTPIPQASSTAAHRISDSTSPISYENSEVNQNVFLKDAIDGLESFVSKFKNAKLQFSQQKDLLLSKNEKMPSTENPTGVYTEVGKDFTSSEADSSLGILKLDDLPGLSEAGLDREEQLLLPENYADEKRDVKELSDLAVDMRHRLQKELAQRAIDRFSFSSCQQETESMNEHENRNTENYFLQKSMNLPDSHKLGTGCNNLKHESNHNSNSCTEDVNDQICSTIDKTGDILNLTEASVQEMSCLETYQNPFDNTKLDSEAIGKMAAMMVDFYAEDFIPGDKCEAKLAADECAWSKENIPPALGLPSATTAKLDFSGIVGNAEISLSSVDACRYGQQKRKISVGEFFRLKSEKFCEPGITSGSFEMQSKSPKKGHQSSLSIVQSELNEHVDQEKSVGKQKYMPQEERTFKSLPLCEGRKSSSFSSSEQTLASRDSLSLSCIADILAKVDTCASPRTVVCNILKQSGLCKSKRTLPIRKTGSVQSSNASSLSDVYIGSDTVLKDTSNVNDSELYPFPQKDASESSVLKYNKTGSVKVASVHDSDSKDVCSKNTSVQKNTSDSVMSNNEEMSLRTKNVCKSDRKGKEKTRSPCIIDLSRHNERKNQLSVSVKSNLTSCSSYDGDGSESDDSALTEDSDGWIFSMPNASKGVGAKLCSSNLMTGLKSEVTETLNNSRNIEQTFTLEDSIASGDLSVLKLDNLVETKKLDESVLCLAQELSSMPRESVDCSALVPTLKQKYPELWPPHSSKDCQRKSKFEWDSSAQYLDSEHNISNNLIESTILLQSMNSTAPFDISELSENKWVVLKTSIQIPVVCVGVPHDIFLPVYNVTDRWILCGLELNEVKLVGEDVDKAYKVALVQLPSKKVLMDPNNYKEAKIEVVPLCEGKLHISLKVHLNDVVTKAMQSISGDLFVMAEEPQIVITKPSDDDMCLDFGILPEECAKEMSLKFRNTGSANIPLKLTTIHQVQDKLSTFVLLDPEKQQNKNMVESEVTRELEFTLKAGTVVNATVMFAAPPMRLLTKQRGLLKLSGILSLELIGIVPVKLESFDLTGVVGTTKLGIFRPAIPMQLIIGGPGQTESCQLPIRNHGVVPLSLALELLASDESFISMTVEPNHVQLQSGEQVAPIIKFTSSKPLKEPVHSVLQITMQPHGPQYFVEVSGVMTTDSDRFNKPSKSRPQQVIDATKSPLALFESEFDKHHEIFSSSRSSTGSSSGKSGCSSGRQFSVKSGSSIDQSSTKLQKGSSDSSKSGKKLNVRTTHRQLVWGSVAVGKTITKTFTIRSEDQYKLAVYVYIEDKFNAFELIEQDGHIMKQDCVMLHPMKEHSFRVNFKPQIIGAAYGKLVFIIQGVHLIIPMYGFGGHARLIAKGVPRDGAGRMWIMLCQHPNKTEWETSFSLRNLGDLKAFIKIKSISKGFQNISKMNLLVDPSEIVISEGESTEIRVKYKPQQQDLKFLLSNSIQDVVEVAVLSLVSGDEATRHRLRRIHEKNLNIAKKRGNSKLVPKNADLDFEPLCAQFPGEKVQFAPDIIQLKEPQDSALELYNAGVNHQEIILLLENSTDGQGADASRAFQSMYQYVVDLSTTRHEELEQSVGMDEVWEIHPSMITLQPPHISRATVLLQTSGVHRQSFEAVIFEQPPGFTLSVSPSAGFIPACDGVELTVSCTSTDVTFTSHPNCWRGIIKVYIENDFKELNVYIQDASVHKNEVLGKKSTSSASCKCSEPQSSVDRHPSSGALSLSTPSRKSILSIPTVHKKRLNNVGHNHKVLSGTAKKNITPLKSFKNMIVLGKDYSHSSPHQLRVQPDKTAKRQNHIVQRLPVSTGAEEATFGLEGLVIPKVVSSYKQTKSRNTRSHVHASVNHGNNFHSLQGKNLIRKENPFVWK